MFHTLVRLLGYLAPGLGLLPLLVGTAYLLLAGTVARFLLQGRCRTLGSLRLFEFGTQFGSVDDGERVAHLYMVAFLHPQFHDAAGHLARHAVFGHLHLALDGF